MVKFYNVDTMISSYSNLLLWLLFMCKTWDSQATKKTKISYKAIREYLINDFFWMLLKNYYVSSEKVQKQGLKAFKQIQNFSINCYIKWMYIKSF